MTRKIICNLTKPNTFEGRRIVAIGQLQPMVVILAVLVAVFGSPKPALAVPITAVITGEATFVNPSLASTFSVGDTMTATLTYESSTTASGGGPISAFFIDAITASSFSVGSFSGVLAPGAFLGANEIDLINQPVASDTIRFVHNFVPTLPPLVPFRFDVGLRGTGLLSGLALPTSINPTDFTSGVWSLGFHTSPARTTFVNAVSGQIFVKAPIPEPSTYALFTLGLGAMGIYHRRKMKNTTTQN